MKSSAVRVCVTPTLTAEDRYTVETEQEESLSLHGCYKRSAVSVAESLSGLHRNISTSGSMNSDMSYNYIYSRSGNGVLL